MVLSFIGVPALVGCMARKVRRNTALFGFMLVIGLMQAPSYAGDSIDSYTQPLLNPIARQIRFQLTIENPSSEPLRDQIIWLYVPVKRTATQQLQALDVSMPYKLEEDILGNQIVRLHIDLLPPYGTKLVNIKADLLMSPVPALSNLKGKELFLAEERYIETNEHSIQALTGRLTGSHPAETAFNIYEWIRTNMQYAGYIADDLGARHAVTTKSGDCTEYAYLAAALARAGHINARVLGGYVLDRNGSPKAEEYHNWAEVYVDGAWRLLDAQKENFQANQAHYVVMRIISQHVSNSLGSAHRFRIQGNASVRMN